MTIHRTVLPRYRASCLRISQIRSLSSTPAVRGIPRPSTATPFGVIKKVPLPKHDAPSLKYKKPKKNSNPPPKKTITISKFPVVGLDLDDLRSAERTNLGFGQPLRRLSPSHATISPNLRDKGLPPDEQLDYTGRVTIKGPADTSHRLFNLYDGEVTEVEGPRTKVTVKVLKKIGSGPEDSNFNRWTVAVHKRLKNEIAAWKDISGPFVHYIGFAIVDGVPAVLTQVVEGTAAKDYLEGASIRDKRFLVRNHSFRPRLSYAELDSDLLASNQILAFADALKALHAEQLWHGNLEPPHFVVDTKGKAKLSGFCFNHMIERELSKVKTPEEHHRSARYAAPEVLEDKTVFDKSDVYSFACVALELMTGKQPFHEVPQETAVRNLVIEGNAPFAGDYSELMHDPWWITFKSCLSRDPETRPSMKMVYKERYELGSEKASVTVGICAIPDGAGGDPDGRPSTATPFGVAKKLHPLKYKNPKKPPNPPNKIVTKFPVKALNPDDPRLAERTKPGFSVQALTKLSVPHATISANLRGDNGLPPDDYTGRVTIQGPADTSHRLLNLYDGEVTGAEGPSKVLVNVLKVVGGGPGDHSFDKWTAAVYKRLTSEIGDWKKINGPFVHYIGFARIDNVPAVLTQAVEGTRAKDFLKSASIQDRRFLIVGFAEALEALHAEQLPHGNLEPQHFVVDTKGTAKLSGFCFNHMIERELSKVKPFGEHHRSARYAAPEVLEEVDKSDVYSFACIALELMTGEQPFYMVKGELQ